jgi:hypothetical protein
MSTLDPARDPTAERLRLARFYAEMTDGELEALAAVASSLTEPARAALRAELSRRHLDVELSDAASPRSEVEIRPLVTIRRFRDLPEALVAKGILESAGIESSFQDDTMVRMDWFWSNLLGGVKLRVAPEDALVASELLEGRIPERIEVPGVGEQAQPRCPDCGSLDVSFEDLNKAVAAVSTAIGVPIALHPRRWKCHGCGHTWREPEDSAA